MRIIISVVFSLLVAVPPGYLLAQEASAASENPQETIVPGNPRPPFVERLLQDQKDMWSRPFKVKRSDAAWLVPLGLGAAALIATDRNLSDGIKNAEGIRPTSRALSKLGGGGPVAIAAGALWGVGKLTGNSRAAKTGQLTAEALLHTTLAVHGLKEIFSRERPDKLDGQGEFWGGGRSFPSGHAATSFAFATVVAHQYKHKPLIQIGAYGLAAAVSLSRVGGLNHFPSDVLVGATIGHLIGRFVLNRNKND